MEITRRTLGTLMGTILDGNTLSSKHFDRSTLAVLRADRSQNSGDATLVRDSDRLMADVLAMKDFAQNAPRPAQGSADLHHYNIPREQVARYPSFRDTAGMVSGPRTFSADGQVTSFDLEGIDENFSYGPAEKRGTPTGGILYRIADGMTGDMTEVVEPPDGGRTITRQTFAWE